MRRAPLERTPAAFEEADANLLDVLEDLEDTEALLGVDHRHDRTAHQRAHPRGRRRSRHVFHVLRRSRTPHRARAFRGATARRCASG